MASGGVLSHRLQPQQFHRLEFPPDRGAELLPEFPNLPPTVTRGVSFWLLTYYVLILCSHSSKPHLLETTFSIWVRIVAVGAGEQGLGLGFAGRERTLSPGWANRLWDTLAQCGGAHLILCTSDSSTLIAKRFEN